MADYYMPDTLLWTITGVLVILATGCVILRVTGDRAEERRRTAQARAIKAERESGLERAPVVITPTPPGTGLMDVAAATGVTPTPMIYVEPDGKITLNGRRIHYSCWRARRRVPLTGTYDLVCDDCRPVLVGPAVDLPRRTP